MGQDKALLDWNGVPLLNHMISLLQAATDPVRIVGREPLPDIIPDHGPLSGIATALEISSTENNLVVAVDLPLLTQNFLKYFSLKLESSSRLLVACRIGSALPLCLGIRKSLLPEIHRRLGTRDLSVHGLVQDCAAEILEQGDLETAGFRAEIFRNINTPADYLRTSSVPPVQ